MAFQHRATIVSPELEQQWSNEVHYLHSLWHQGPPTSNPQSAINVPTNLAPSPTVSFKKRKNKKNIPQSAINEVSAADDPWLTSLPKPVETETTEWKGWPDQIPLPEFPTQVSVEEQEKFAAIQLQRKSIMDSQVFFSRNKEDDESDQDEGEEKVKEREEMEFFAGIFKGDDELRSYYEKNWERGVFSCLACGGIGEKVGKRFRNVGALVQHSLTIAKTKGRRAHRAYGKAICQLLGWNCDKFPSITKKSDELGDCVLLDEDPEEHHNNTVGEEQNGIHSNEADCLMELDKSCQTEYPLPPELEVIPLSSTNAHLVPVTPITDVEVVPHLQTESLLSKPESLTLVPVVEAVSNPPPGISVSKPQSLTPLPVEELEKYAAIQLQGNTILACQTFFSSNKERTEDEEIAFFVGLFKDDNNELKSYYEKNSQNGEFCCLVCDGIGNKKVGKRFKRFKNCVSLIQHSFTISNAIGRSAHRAFGKVICQVLGWNTSTHGRLLIKADSGTFVQGDQANANNQCEATANQESSLIPSITKTIDIECNNVRVVLNLCPLNSTERNSFKLVNFSLESRPTLLQIS